MATAEELLAQMEENPELYADSIGPVNDVIVINAEERTIELPESEKIFGVESDKASERKYFNCPKIVGDNIDLSTLNLFINFKNANNEGDIYAIDDVAVEGDYITFSWKLSKKVTAYKTDASKNQLLSFIFCAKNGEGPENEWNTTICSDGIVLEGLEPGESIAEDNPDIIQYILERLDSTGTITPEQISGAVEEYFASNPIQAGATEEQARQIEKNTQDISKLSDEIANKEASGTAVAKVSEHNTSDASHNDIRLILQDFQNRLDAFLDTDDVTMDQVSELINAIKSNQSLIDAITTSKVSVSDIIDNLTTNVSNKPLSASQGVALKGLIDALQTELEGIEIPTKLSNPNSLKITYGGQEYNYDGSETKEIVIDSASIDEDELNTMLQEVLA